MQLQEQPVPPMRLSKADRKHWMKQKNWQRKVNRDENIPPLNSSTNSQSNESSMAAMLRERLHIMQSDSSDEFDSSSDFSI